MSLAKTPLDQVGADAPKIPDQYDRASSLGPVIEETCPKRDSGLMARRSRGFLGGKRAHRVDKLTLGRPI